MNLNQILKHIPEGCEAPTPLQDFIKAKPPFRIEWNSMASYKLKRAAAKQVVPFMRLYDGGLVALWYHAPEPAVVQVGSEGETEVLARTFEEFVRAVNVGKSGLSDLDLQETKFAVPGISGKAPKNDEALQKKFDAWFAEQGTDPKPNTQDEEAQALLRRICAITKQMVDDGCVKPPALPHLWEIAFEAAMGSSGLRLTYVKFGKKWNDPIKSPAVPSKYKLHGEIEALIKLCKHKNLRHYRIKVDNECLFVTGPLGNVNPSELALMTPAKLARLEAYREDERQRRRAKK